MTGQGTSSNGHLTLAALAELKRLPVDFLRSKPVSLSELRATVQIPYYGVTGEVIAVKRRTALKAKDGSYWPKGRPLAIYGQWRLHEAQKAGFLVAVEGESDCWALWFHGLPALGIPGANTVQTVLHREDVESIGKNYIHHEPDEGGENFVRCHLERLGTLGFHGKVFKLRMPDGLKDLADLHAADPEKFKSRLEAAICAPTPLTAAP